MVQSGRMLLKAGARAEWLWPGQCQTRPPIVIYVRHTPVNGHSRQARQCPLIANNSRSAKANIGLAVSPFRSQIGTLRCRWRGAADSQGMCQCPCGDDAVARLKRSQRITSKKPNHPLLESDRITSADHAALEHCGIDTHVGLIVLGRRPKDAHILGEIALGQRCHYAPRAGAINT